MAEIFDRSNVTVLFVDDEENILRSLERLLIDEEFTVITANSGEAGLNALAAAQQVAVIVSDQRMPGMGGAEFLGKSRDFAPDAVRMVLTGYADANAAMDAINKGGAARYLSKPWDDTMLVQAVRDGVDYFLAMTENRRLAAIVQQQNEELKEWNANLKGRVMDQTSVIRRQNEDLGEKNLRLNQGFIGMIQAFSRLVELCSPRLHSHARNVTEIATGIARDKGLPEEQIETIRTAALLHDIGVIGIPETILAKRYQDMTPEERRIFQQHSIRGQTALDAVEELRGVALLIRHHHEQFNGGGYPDKLHKDEIPLGARIIGFADYIDREMGNMRGEEALDEVLNGTVTLQMGGVLDPSLAAAAKRIAKYVYYTQDGKVAAGVESEYKAKELVTGMEVTRDIYSGTGLLLMTKGVILDRQMIESIQRYYEIDPPSRGVYATVPRRGA